MAKKGTGRRAQGEGSMRKKTVTRNGVPYTYWEARITTGFAPGTGRQEQRSFSGKTQKAVREKSQAETGDITHHEYLATAKRNGGDWVEIWERE